MSRAYHDSTMFFFNLKKNIAPPALSKPFWGIFSSVHLTAKVIVGVLFGVCDARLLFCRAFFFRFWPLTIITWVAIYFFCALMNFCGFFCEITVDIFLLNNFLQKLLMLFCFVWTHFEMILARSCIRLGCGGISMGPALIYCVFDC